MTTNTNENDSVDYKRQSPLETTNDISNEIGATELL